jgi:hypothetical protein
LTGPTLEAFNILLERAQGTFVVMSVCSTCEIGATSLANGESQLDLAGYSLVFDAFELGLRLERPFTTSGADPTGLLG